MNSKTMATMLGACMVAAAPALGGEPATADMAERAAILDLMERTFAAVASDEPEDWRPLLIEGARDLSFRPHPDGPAGALLMRDGATSDSFASMVPGDDKYHERWLGEPEILLRGPIAVVWGEYDFWIDGKFSHCGVDTANVVKVDGEWKIAHFMWTVEPEGCASAGDAFPRGKGD